MSRRWAALPGAGATLAVTVAVCACATVLAPTYPQAALRLSGCPRAVVAPGRTITLRLTVVNRSLRTWPATYVLASFPQPLRVRVTVRSGSSKGIGGGITRVTQPLRAGAGLSARVTARVSRAPGGTLTLGAWGAPANSVPVPSSYPSRQCAFRTPTAG